MELQFKKVGKRWVAEFEATGNFNLNIERVEPSKIKIYQKGSEEGEYASSASWEINYAPSVVDNDFSALIYPKFIKVVSESEPIQGIVTMDSESGGSGAGGGLRPATADDIQVSLHKEMGGDSIIEDWTNELEIPSNATINIYSKKEAPMYINTSTLSGLNVSYLSLLNRISIYNGAQGALNLILDIYIKD